MGALRFLVRNCERERSPWRKAWRGRVRQQHGQQGLAGLGGLETDDLEEHGERDTV